MYLAEATADQLWLVKDGRAEIYDGDLNDYRALVLQADRDKPETAKVARQKNSKKNRTGETADAPGANTDKAEARRRASDARKAAAPLKQKADDAERRLAKATKRIEEIDADLAAPGQPAELLQDLMRDRASLSADVEQAEEDWLAASEAYERAVSTPS